MRRSASGHRVVAEAMADSEGARETKAIASEPRGLRAAGIGSQMPVRLWMQNSSIAVLTDHAQRRMIRLPINRWISCPLIPGKRDALRAGFTGRRPPGGQHARLMSLFAARRSSRAT